MFKFLLPLIAALKFKHGHESGRDLGREVAQAYKGCKASLAAPQFPKQLASATASNAEAQVGIAKN
ncbi:hypothetical protein GmRootV118_17900 [Variovorax sp. V118]|uniref:hypothetical protein n=1 Tax=Variovorax sp. V118 TaxID=3065954 RepID=UPI0034E8FB00